ncbi:MAG TPA: PH domain-containing protein [Devosiaceae bacterium]|jgi:uncharacterized membrane protein YdbT with pleckstrin-like domain
MSYVKKVLQPNETVVAEGRKHWIIYVPGLLLIILALLVFFVGPAVYDLPLVYQIVAGLFGLFGLITLLRAWFLQWTTEIAVTNRRLIYKTGFISRFTTEMNMDKIESVAVDQTLFGRLFGYGTVSARGTGVGIENLEAIADPLQLRSAIVVR